MMVLCLVGLLVRSHPATASEKGSSYVGFADLPLASFSHLGARSCASTSCHGGSTSAHLYSGTNGREFLIWLENDPHTRSLVTLDEPRSQRIIDQLVEHTPQEDRAEARQRVLNRCFACHAGTIQAVRDDHTAKAIGSVSCEACHGPASGWIGEHYQPYWKRLGSDQKAALGMFDTGNLLRRAQTCARCHVGSPGRDVDHDLIAAGHPVLKFELAGYLSRMPKHWNGYGERRANDSFESRVWAAGQLAAGRSSFAATDHPGRRRCKTTIQSALARVLRIRMLCLPSRFELTHRPVRSSRCPVPDHLPGQPLESDDHADLGRNYPVSNQVPPPT